MRTDGDFAGRLAAVAVDPTLAPALATVGSGDPLVRARLLALRGAVAAASVDARIVAWDPRLNDVVALARGALQRFEHGDLELPPVSLEHLAERVGAARRASRPVDPQLDGARDVLGGPTSPVLVDLHAALLEIARRCDQVAAHAQDVVARTLDPQAGARYLRLRALSEALADAARAATDER